MPQVCAAAHPKGFANDQCAQMLRPGKHPGTFFDCLIVWALPSIHSIEKPSQPLKIRLDCRPLVPCGPDHTSSHTCGTVQVPFNPTPNAGTETGPGRGERPCRNLRFSAPRRSPQNLPCRKANPAVVPAASRLRVQLRGADRTPQEIELVVQVGLKLLTEPRQKLDARRCRSSGPGPRSSRRSSFCIRIRETLPGRGRRARGDPVRRALGSATHHRSATK